MKEISFKTILLFCLSFILIGIIGNIFFNFNESYFAKTINEFYESKDDYEVVFFGSSHAFNTYNPEIFDKTLGIKSLNLGSAAQKLKTTQFLIDEITNKSKTKVVVLDLFVFSSSDVGDDKKVKDYQLAVFNNVKNSFQKLKNVSDYGFNSSLSSFFPLFRNHNKWYEVFNKTENKKTNSVVNGYLPLKGTMKLKEKEEYFDYYLKDYNYISEIDLKNENLLDNEVKNSLIQLAKTLKDKNIELIFVSAPFFSYLYSEDNKKFNAGIKKLSDSLNINFIDFNSKFHSLDLNFIDFKEEGHLNVKGSNKISAYLANYLAQEKGFKIESDELLKKHLFNIKPLSVSEIENEIDLSNSAILSKTIKEGTIYETNKSLLPEVFITNVYLFKDNDISNKVIALELKSPINFDKLNSLDLGIHLLFKEEDYDKRPKWMLGTDKDRETVSVSPNIVKLDSVNYLILKFKANDLINYKKMRLFLKDKGKFKGVIGEALEIDNVTFKN